MLDANDDEYTFYYEASTADHGVYFTVESYLLEQVPTVCTTSGDDTAPVAYFCVDNECMWWFYAQHAMLYVDSADFESDHEFEITVEWDWVGSPRRDFTVMVYSADGNDVEDEDGETNMLYTDGQSPSEFDEFGSEREVEDLGGDSGSEGSDEGSEDGSEEESEGGSMTTVVVAVVLVGAAAATIYFLVL